MKPYYEDDYATIYHGDCREVLAGLETFDLMLTDPPYGVALDTDNTRFSGGHTASVGRRGNGIGTGRGKPIANDATPFDPAFLLPFARHKVIWGWNNFPDKLPRGACLVWLKRHDEAFGTFLSDAETAWMSKGSGVYCCRDLSNNGITRERVHPTQKPVSLMGWCLNFFPHIQTVIDPYAGSGSSLVAAKERRIKCVGIEIEEEHCEAAARRLQQEVLAF